MVKITYKYRVQIPVPMDTIYQAQLGDGTYLFNNYKSVWVDGSEMCNDNEVKERVRILKLIDGGEQYKDIEVVKQ